MVQAETVGAVCVIRVDAVRLDSPVGTVIRNTIASRLQPESKFVIDLAKVKLVDSGGLGSLVAALKTVNGQQAKLVLSSMQKSVKLMFELSRMDRQFALADDLDAALATLA